MARDRKDLPVRWTTLEEQGKERDLEGTTAAERLAMMWPLAVQAWAFMGEDVAESRLPRHVVRMIRREPGRTKDAMDARLLEDQEVG